MPLSLPRTSTAPAALRLLLTDLGLALGPFGVDLFGVQGDTIEIPWSSIDQEAIAPNGSLSDSSRASREKGRRFHEHMVDNLVQFIEWRRHQRGPIGRTPATVRGKESA
jgi:creatinine amidohydrolase